MNTALQAVAQLSRYRFDDAVASWPDPPPEDSYLYGRQPRKRADEHSCAHEWATDHDYEPCSEDFPND